MSSTHSSPTKRSVLSPKPSNISNSSPFGKRYTRLTPSPTKHSFKSTTPSPKKSTALGFTIWEDKVDKSNSTTDVVGQTTSNKLNHNDQENILQPKKEEIVRYHNKRRVLGNLSINEYKGYITIAGTRSQLNELYQPINFDNEFKSLHKQLNLPSYLTPSRKNRDKYLVKSGIDEIEELQEDGSSDEDGDEDDEVEVLLAKKKQQRVSSSQTHMIRKHTRSMSVGKNDSKLHLIRKNKFSILSN